MKDFLTILVGVGLLVGGGAVHGLWTERWGRLPEVEEAAARLEGLPERFGEWQGAVLDQDAESLAVIGAVGTWSRRFRHEKTGETVLVILLCGRSGQMVVHRPEDCYRTAGYALLAPPIPFRLPLAEGAEPAELWTGVFVKDDAFGPVYQRIFWAWGAEGRWMAPERPRIALTRYRALYKLYVMRLLQGPNDPLSTDPARSLMEQLLPELDRRLFPTSP